MKKVLALVSVLAVASGAQATWIENFDYSDGGLVANSGGTWVAFPGWPLVDATVASGIAQITDPSVAPDVVAFPGNCLAILDHAKFSFQYYTPGGITLQNPQVNLLPGDGTSISYGGGGIALFFNTWASGSLSSLVDGVAKNYSTYSLNTWHTLDLYIYKAIDNTLTYSLVVDGSVEGYTGGTLSDPRGLNTIEMGTQGGTSNYVLIDNVFLGVPEPVSVTLFALFGLGALWIRMRRNR